MQKALSMSAARKHMDDLDKPCRDGNCTCYRVLKCTDCTWRRHLLYTCTVASGGMDSQHKDISMAMRIMGLEGTNA